MGEASGSSKSSSSLSPLSLSAMAAVKSRCWPVRPLSSDTTELAYEFKGGVEVRGICLEGWMKDPIRAAVAETELPLVERA